MDDGTTYKVPCDSETPPDAALHIWRIRLMLKFHAVAVELNHSKQVEKFMEGKTLMREIKSEE